MTLLVFSDDWGRHPSSCQYLVRELLDRTDVYWVNTIGMRRPKLEWYTATRGLEKLVHWLAPKKKPEELPPRLRVVNPIIWPGFGWRMERSINRRLVMRSLRPILDSLSEPPLAVTTVPIVADLIGEFTAQRWVYYCVDDFTTWPGLDHRNVERMETRLIDRADEIVVVSETLRNRVAERGKSSTLLTHGVDVDFWKASPGDVTNRDVAKPLLLFWGLIDQRMDTEILTRLSERRVGTVILVGPSDNPDPRLRCLPGVIFQPALPLPELPQLAASADILILPYADLPVTRAIQPLKLKEYLATGKPVVARDLPAVREWSDCLDLADSPANFVDKVVARLAEGIPASQTIARKRLSQESWKAKADQFYRIVTGE